MFYKGLTKKEIDNLPGDDRAEVFDFIQFVGSKNGKEPLNERLSRKN